MADFERAIELLKGHCADKLVLVDVGARWGATERWQPINDVAEIIGFEPDQAECERLNASRPPNVRFLPVGLSDAAGEVDLFVTSEPACSSIYPPIRQLYETYLGLGIITPVRTTRMQCRRLGDVLPEYVSAPVAALKLDTQGSELAILRGATKALERCCLIDIEVEFNPIYSGQALFCDVDRFLRDQGFVLWRLENLVHYPAEIVAGATNPFLIATACMPDTTVCLPSSGQLFWSQAQYVRAEYPRTGIAHIPLSEAIRAALLAGAYGFWDLAVELIRKAGDDQLLQDLRNALQPG
jgi:FkbM family methyltransferase